MTDQSARSMWPWSVIVVISLLATVDVRLALTRPAFVLPYDVGTAAFTVAFLCPGLAGVLIASRRPHNPTGWLMLAISLAAITGGLLSELARRLYTPDLELGAALFIAGDGLARTVLLLIALLLMLLPNGQFLSKRWRALAYVGIAITGLVAILQIGAPGPLDDFAVASPPVNPFAMRAWGPGAIIAFALFVGLFIFVVLAAVSVVARYRRAGPESRLQLKWIALAASLLAIALVAGNAFVATSDRPGGHAPLPVSLAEVVAFAALWTAIAVAILRHRLFDVDLVISRTVAYGALVVIISALYIAVVAGVGSLLAVGSTSRLVLAVVVTAAVAVAFQPLRSRLERFANRLVYGKRAAPYEVLAEFTSRLGGRQSSAELIPTMARMLAQGTASDEATVWATTNGHDVAAASFPEGSTVGPGSATRVVPVQHAGQMLGHLAVRRLSGEPLTPTEERLMDGLASQAGLVLHNAGLQDELSRRMLELRGSRHRLVTAQDEARRRLERDLHDGAQQNLVSLRMKLGLAANVARGEPASLEPLLQEMQAELGDALDSLRNLARGLYPPLLEAEGLKAALRARARQVPVSVDVKCGSERYTRELEGAVYFCCSEALQNLTKHSRATHGSVRVWAENGRLHFDVSDNGRGLDPSRGKSAGGLQNIRDRIDVLGGVVDVSSAAGAGARVAGWVPLSAETNLRG